MASTNKTTNYELSQFIETDRPAWLTDYNGDMRKLDTALKAVSDVASGASGSISELADRMSTAEGNISTNTNDIATLDARADALEAGAQSTAGTIANIQTEQTAQNLGIEAATELGYNLARPYDSASTYAVGAYVLFQNTLYKCVTAVSTGEAFDPTKWIAIKATDEIGSGGASYVTENIDLSTITLDTGSLTWTPDLANSYFTIKYNNDVLYYDFYFRFETVSISANTNYQIGIRIPNNNRFPAALQTLNTTLAYSANTESTYRLITQSDTAWFNVYHQGLSSGGGTIPVRGTGVLLK